MDGYRVNRTYRTPNTPDSVSPLYNRSYNFYGGSSSPGYLKLEGLDSLQQAGAHFGKLPV